MMDERVQTISTYHLIYELLEDGEGNLYPEMEPIARESIVSALQRRHACNWGSTVELWVEWFVASPDAGTEEERQSIAAVAQIKKIEKEGLRRIKAEDEGS